MAGRTPVSKMLVPGRFHFPLVGRAAPRTEYVNAVVARVRRSHPEAFERPLRLEHWIEVAKANAVHTYFRPCLPYFAGRTVPGLGDAWIHIDHRLAPDELLLLFLHEMGHALLHAMDSGIVQAHEREVERLGVGVGPVHRRLEFEANLFASLVVGVSVEEFTASLRRAISTARNGPLPVRLPERLVALAIGG